MEKPMDMADQQMQATLDKLHTDLNTILNSKEYASQSPNEPVYHYTDLGGTEGILNSKSLWMTSYTQLNDPSEIEYGLKILSEIIGLQLKKSPDNKLWQILLDGLEKVIKEEFDIYVVSFCLKSNYLPAWRLYADDARGCSIGFSADFFSENNRLSKSENEPIMGRVEYGPKKLSAFCNDIISILDQAYSEFIRQFSDQQNSWLFALCTEFVRKILPHLPLTKHPAYEEEHEYRLYWANPIGKMKAREPSIPDECKFLSVGRAAIVRRAKIAFDVKYIKDIYLGPNNDQNVLKRSVQDLLQTNGYETHVKVLVSDIPYKNKGTI